MSSYRVSQRAKDDLRSIWDYIADDSEINADRVLSQIADSFEFLAANPISGDPWHAGRPNQRVHSVPGLPCAIFFFPTRDGVEISQVTYGGRNLDALRFD